MYVTAGRVGSFFRRTANGFKFMHWGVKVYEIRTGRDGVSRFKFKGAVENTITLDRWLRDKKVRMAQAHAKECGGTYVPSIKHNDQVHPLQALAASMEEK